MKVINDFNGRTVAWIDDKDDGEMIVYFTDGSKAIFMACCCLAVYDNEVK